MLIRYVNLNEIILLQCIPELLGHVILAHAIFKRQIEVVIRLDDFSKAVSCGRASYFVTAQSVNINIHVRCKFIDVAFTSAFRFTIAHEPDYTFCLFFSGLYELRLVPRTFFCTRSFRIYEQPQIPDKITHNFHPLVITRFNVKIIDYRSLYVALVIKTSFKLTFLFRIVFIY